MGLFSTEHRVAAALACFIATGLSFQHQVHRQPPLRVLPGTIVCWQGCVDASPRHVANEHSKVPGDTQVDGRPQVKMEVKNRFFDFDDFYSKLTYL